MAEDYRVLVGHRRTDGSFKSAEELRMEYLQLTDRLIMQLTLGFDALGPDGSELAGAVPDAVIYLDKSARPVEWLVRGAWPRLSPLEVGGPVPPRPASLFLHIDRLNWINEVDPQGLGRMDADLVPRSVIWSLRSVFVEPAHKRRGLNEAIEAAPAALDGRTILVVDEVNSTGRTASIARGLLRRAFPSITIGHAHWMGGLAQRGGAIGNRDLPVWYDESTELGRGVGDRVNLGGTDVEPTNITQALGRLFLSTRLTRPDPKGAMLREEIRRLTADPDVPIRVSTQREDAVERMEWLNGRQMAEILDRIRAILPDRLGR